MNEEFKTRNVIEAVNRLIVICKLRDIDYLTLTKETQALLLDAYIEGIMFCRDIIRKVDHTDHQILDDGHCVCEATDEKMTSSIA